MNGKKILVWALIVVFSLSTFGCSLFKKKAAIVNGDPIYMEDVDEQLGKIEQQHKTAEQKKTFVQQKKEFEKSILDQLINDKLYEQEAKKMKIKVTDKEVEDEVNKTKKRFPDEKAFEKALKDAQFTEDDLNDFIRKNLLVKRVNEKVVGKIEITDKETKEYYDQNMDQFKDPEQVQTSHILVETEEEANNVKAEIDGGLAFADAAKEHSTDPASKDKGGDLGQVQKGMMAPEFEEAAFAGSAGELVGPIKTQFGYHLILVGEKTEEKQKTYEESLDSIKQMLKAQKETDKIKKWLDEVKKKSTIKKYI